VIENNKQKLMKLLDRIDSRVMIACSLIFVVGIILYAGFMPRRDKPINPAAFRPLLNLIAEGESNNNYNAYFGNPNNQEVDFTSMTVAEVMTWQKEFVSQGNPSSAVGRYQIINKTLSGHVNQLEVDTNETFD
jgi:muramidase (phage lysozyme)